MTYKDSFKFKKDTIQTNHGWYSNISDESLNDMKTWFGFLERMIRGFDQSREEDFKKFFELTNKLSSNKIIAKIILRHLEQSTDQLEWEQQLREVLETEECSVKEAIEVVTYER